MRRSSSSAPPRCHPRATPPSSCVLALQREHDGCLLKCVYFTERSPVISCSIGVPSQDAFNMTNWKRELSVYLKMPGVDTIYIVDARFEARERAVARVTGGELQRKLSRALLRESEKILKVEFLILSDSGDDWSYQGFVAALRASLDSETGRSSGRGLVSDRSLWVRNQRSPQRRQQPHRNLFKCCQRRTASRAWEGRRTGCRVRATPRPCQRRRQSCRVRAGGRVSFRAGWAVGSTPRGRWGRFSGPLLWSVWQPLPSG